MKITVIIIIISLLIGLIQHNGGRANTTKLSRKQITYPYITTSAPSSIPLRKYSESPSSFYYSDTENHYYKIPPSSSNYYFTSPTSHANTHVVTPSSVYSNAHYAPHTVVTHDKGKPSIDLKKWGIIALIKIGIAKLKTFGILKLLFFMLFKLKLVLIALFVKFVLFMKALKFLKALLIPFALLSLLGPLLSLLTLPLALLLPTLLTAAPVVTGGKSTFISKLKHNDKEETPQQLLMRELIQTGGCTERIACMMAVMEYMPLTDGFLNKNDRSVENDELSNYINAYQKSKEEYNGLRTNTDAKKWCMEKYQCENKKKKIVDP